MLKAIPIDSSLRLNAAECAAFAKRRRRKLFILFGLITLSWLVVGTLIAAFA